MSNLKLVATDRAAFAHTRILVVSQGRTTQVEAVEKETPIALIGFALSGFYVLGDLIETGTPYGVQVSAEVSYLWRGEKRTVVGAVVPLVDGPDLVLPIGTLGN